MSEGADVCIANIGPRERRKRMRFGVIGIALGAGVGALLIALGFGRLWRLGVLLPFWVGTVGLFQALEKT
jgi:hypothetical protein